MRSPPACPPNPCHPPTSTHATQLRPVPRRADRVGQQGRVRLRHHRHRRLGRPAPGRGCAAAACGGPERDPMGVTARCSAGGSPHARSVQSRAPTHAARAPCASRLPAPAAFGGADANNWPAAYGYGQRKKAHHHKKARGPSRGPGAALRAPAAGGGAACRPAPEQALRAAALAGRTRHPPTHPPISTTHPPHACACRRASWCRSRPRPLCSPAPGPSTAATERRRMVRRGAAGSGPAPACWLAAGAARSAPQCGQHALIPAHPTPRFPIRPRSVAMHPGPSRRVQLTPSPDRSPDSLRRLGNRSVPAVAPLARVPACVNRG